MNKYIPFNLNHNVKIKIKPKGFKILESAYNEQNIFYGGKLLPYQAPEVDTEGYTTYQAWDFINKFGAYFYCGFDVPIETEILIESERSPTV